MCFSNRFARLFIIVLTSAGPAACGANQAAAPQVPATSVQPPHQLKPSSRPARYRLIDLGSFGGPNSGLALGYNPDQGLMNNRGIVTGAADTAQSDPHYPYTNPLFTGFGTDPYIQHAFAWRSSDLEDLGALPGTNSSFSLTISENSSYAAGVSTNDTIDPLTGYVEARAVVWKGSRITDIGTFGGNESFAAQVNDRGEVAGVAANATADPYNFFGWGTQADAFLWRGGTAHDLGTLGGPDSAANWINNSGQVAGWAYTNDIPNSQTGIPTNHPFLWEPRIKTMRDLGTIGGTNTSQLNGLNERGEVVGQMSIAGDIDYHAFVWTGKRLIDLGTLGGPNSSAFAINDAGDVAGEAEVSSGCGSSFPHFTHATLWRNDKKLDLGVLRGASYSFALGMNAKDQVVGFSGVCNGVFSAFLWEHGSLVDLNSIVGHHPKFHLGGAFGINDSGEIAGVGYTSNAVHAFVLIPCSDNADCGEQSANSREPVVPNDRIRDVLSQAVRALLEPRQRIPWPPFAAKEQYK